MFVLVSFARSLPFSFGNKNSFQFAKIISWSWPILGFTTIVSHMLPQHCDYYHDKTKTPFSNQVSRKIFANATYLWKRVNKKFHIEREFDLKIRSKETLLI